MAQIKITAFVDRENKTHDIQLDPNSSVKHLLESLKINPVTVIVVRDGNLILEETKLNDRDKLKILSVISGG